MNVQDAWKQGVTGKGISVTILDDGIEKSHPDLMKNYDPLGKKMGATLVQDNIPYIFLCSNPMNYSTHF